MKSENQHTELAPCGIYCGACPSYKKSCHGCYSELKQSRKSKWSCRIRTCCYSIKEISYCFDCEEFPCKIHKRKFLKSHPKDPRFAYRHNIEEDFVRYKELGLIAFLAYQNKKWECESCGTRIHWYHYKCSVCGLESVELD